MSNWWALHQILMNPLFASHWMLVTTSCCRPVVFFLLFRVTSNDLRFPERVGGVHCLSKRVGDNLANMPIVNGDGQSVEVMRCAFVTEADAGIAIPGLHLCCHFLRGREYPALLEEISDSLQVHRTDKTSMSTEKTIRKWAKALDAG